MFKVGDHVILIDGKYNDEHEIGWCDPTMDNLVGNEFVIRRIDEYDDWPSVKLNTLDGMATEEDLWYDIEWLIPANDDTDTSSLDDFFSEWSDE